MNDLIIKTTIEAPTEKVWEVLSDMDIAHKWVPNVTQSHRTSNTVKGLGATRTCTLGYFSSIDERVADAKEGREITLEVYDSKRVPFRSRLRFALEDQDTNTEVTMHFNYTMKGGAIGRMLKPILKPVLRKQLGGTVLGLKYFCENGKKISPSVLKMMQKKLNKS